jgi:glycosyltransferase involved in cell wall biosynthesis
MLKVSIAISNFNYGAFLKTAVESALSQTYQPSEVIVVDDGSTDDSHQVLKPYAGHVRVFRLSHQGETASRNFGFSVCSGDLICFLDADDFLQPDTVARVVEFWKPTFTKVQFHLRVVDRHGVDQRLLMPRCRLDSGIVSSALLRTGRYITSPGSGNFYARSFLERILPVPTDEWPQSFDSYAATYAGFLGEIGAIHAPLGSYRVHKDNMTRAVRSDTLEPAQIDRLLERQLRLRRLIQHIAGEKGLATDPDIVIGHWLYLKLDLAKHAHQSGSSFQELLTIVRKMISSALVAPELSVLKRGQLIAWALGSAFLPRRYANQILKVGFDLAPDSRFTRVMRRL